MSKPLNYTEEKEEGYTYCHNCRYSKYIENGIVCEKYENIEVKFLGICDDYADYPYIVRRNNDNQR